VSMIAASVWSAEPLVFKRSADYAGCAGARGV
jgi:hypothetical protein